MQIYPQPNRRNGFALVGTLVMAVTMAVSSAHAGSGHHALGQSVSKQLIQIVPVQYLHNKDYFALPQEDLILARHRWKKTKRTAKRGWDEFKFILPEKPSFKWKDIKRGKIKPRLSPWGGLFKPRCVGENC